MRKLMIVTKSVIARSDSDCFVRHCEDSVPRHCEAPKGPKQSQSGIASSAFGLLAMTVLLFITSGLALANDVDVYNVALQNYNGAASPKTVDIKFDLSQQNTFPADLTDGNGASYYDRVWIFVKYFNNAWSANTAWKHATLVAGGSVGAYSGGTGFTTDGKGAFCRPGVNQTLRWAIGTDETIDGTETFKIKVFAIEMVYIPQGAFWVGSGGTESGSFTDGSWSSGATIPFKIISQGAITINTGEGNLWGTVTGVANNTIGPAGATDAAFPTGYNAFYCMKYEISQGQYRNFLNTLTQAQQDTRTAAALTNEDDANTYVMIAEDQATPLYRQGIKAGANPADGLPYTFGCDLNDNDVLNEADDGEWLACNYLCWADLCAYADWAGFRPMTELEFEKAARGRKSATDTYAANVTANEYAWGDTTRFATAYTLSNDGTAQEAASNQSTSLGNCSYDTTDGSIDGPLRCGIFAASSTSRVTAGASYYGVMELSGNLWERCVSVGEDTKGRLFTGTHGNGILAVNGNATGTEVSTWPGYNGTSGEVTAASATGSGFRGGHWSNGDSYARVSDRCYAANSYANRSDTRGGRCARTSP